MESIKIFPSLISGDLLNLQQQINLLGPHCEGFHLDVMDDNYVPNLTWGHMFINDIARTTNKQLSVHLMIKNPESFIQRLHLPHGSIVSFHADTVKNVGNFVEIITEKKWVASLAISPKDDLEKSFRLMAPIDHVLLMSVVPGFSGQRFLPESIERLQRLVAWKKAHNPACVIAMDGGINKENIGQLATLGATEFCIASAIFSKPLPIRALELLHEKATT